ncbi:MAG: hypothetical protein K2O29_06335, partial [Ruminococcus sp.]|nr:hypothetical protein [Ruminococcus sp.]
MKNLSDYLDKKCTRIDTTIKKQQKIIEKLKNYKLSLITETVTKGLNPDAVSWRQITAPTRGGQVDWRV